MNYAWFQIRTLEPGFVLFQPRGDKTVTHIEPAGDLHYTLTFHDASSLTYRLDAWLMVQVAHRRRYETSTHSSPLYPAKALRRVYHRTYRRP